MRHALANLALATTTLAGCSLLYNPNDLPAQADAMPDMQMVVDANPAALAISGVAPIAIIEGQGDGNSRKPVIVIEGTDIAQSGVTVEIVASPGATKTPMLTIDPASQVDVYGHHIAVTLTAPVDTTLGAGEVISLDVKVTQDAGGTPVSQTLSGILTLQGRAEWDNNGTTSPALAEGVNQFSRVNLTMGSIAKTTGPVLVEATASINITDMVTANFDGTTTTAGPGGNNGGAGATAVLLTATTGESGMGEAGGIGVAGAAGRPADAYPGDDQLTTINKSEKRANASSGGAGGGVPAAGVLSPPGGRGGGGGGTISFLAGGDIAIGGTISAKGSAGATGTTNGGAGSGGIILVRGGGDVSTAALDVGGPGAAGRVRIDAGGVITTSVGASHRGPTFVNLPHVVNEEKPSFEVQGSPSKGIRYIVIRGTDIEGPHDLTMGNNGRATITMGRPLQQGLNEICLLVEAAPAATYTRNCATIAHIYKTP
jgi:hypothetical protein